MRLHLLIRIVKIGPLYLVLIQSYSKSTLVTFVLPRHMQKKLILSKSCYYDMS